MGLDLEALRQRLHAQATTVTIGGMEWRIGKLSAAETIAILDLARDPEADQEQSGAGTRFYVHLLSKTLLNGSGRAFDSDEARKELLGLLTWDDLKQLGQAAMSFNGLGEDAKKNSATLNEPD